MSDIVERLRAAATETKFPTILLDAAAEIVELRAVIAGPVDEGSLTIPQFAALCRQRCTRPGQREGAACGDVNTDEHGEKSWTFCGNHMGAVIGTD